MASPTDVAGLDADWLSQHGPWGLVVVAFAAILYLFRTLSTERAAHTEEIKQLGLTHKSEMSVLLNRLIETSTKNIEEYHKLANGVTVVLSSIERQLTKRAGGEQVP